MILFTGERGGALSSGSLPRRVSVQGGLCSGGLCHVGSLSGGGLYVRETPPRRRTVKCGQYASYWNAFLLIQKPYQSVMHKALTLHYIRFGFSINGSKIHRICE